MSLFSLLGALEIGLIFSLVALGVFISFRLLRFPDLTVDGSFPLGGAVCATLIASGTDPFTATVVATIAGAAAGLVTGWLNVKLKIMDLLASILMMIALYSINLRIMGKPNVPLITEPTVFTILQPGWISDYVARPLILIVIVILVKLALYPLSVAQYKSMAKMRKFQPRIAQLKERYGDDKQKFQQAMMELYKKEKINPIGGCLPVLLQMPVFFALYWVLLESVELRHTPWMLWIQDLTARDPYFILPVLNIAIMWATQKLTPMVGMDPMQAKIMQFMPLVFGAIMIFFPSGLVLYWVTNGGLGLLQQWWMIRRYSEAPAPAKG